MASTYLSKTFGTATNRKKWTFSAWIKRSTHSVGEAIFSSYSEDTTSWYSRIADNGNGRFDFTEYSGSAYTINLRTNALQRDVNGWYHIVWMYDSAQATASDRVKYYINGEQITSWSVETYPSQNQESGINKAQAHAIGKNLANPDGYYFDGYMAHFHFCDGYAYDASAFGEYDATTGIWKPITEPSVTYGNNGFFLKFENSGSMGLDSSGNANNFTVSGNLIQTVDTPSNVFVTFNPLDTTRTSSATPLFQNGNTTAYNAASDGSYLASAMAVNKGKWYAEFKVGAGANTRNFGILDVTSSLAYIGHPTSGSATNSYAYNSLAGGGLLRDGNTEIASSVGTTTNGDIVSVMIDLDSATKTIKFQKNGVDLSGTTQMTISQSSDTYWIFALRADGDQYVYANFGNGYFGTTAVSSATTDESGLGIFEYTVPSGYYALCTKNINTQG